MAAEQSITVAAVPLIGDFSFLLDAAKYLSLLLPVVIIGMALMLHRKTNRKKLPAAGTFAYRPKPQLFTPAETLFLHVLDQALGKHYRVFGKVRVADVLDAAASEDTRQWQDSFDRIKAKHFDYVVCSADSLDLKLAVELDDSSHQRPDRAERDAFLEKACRMAEFPLVRFPVQRSYAAHDVQGRLHAHL